ncbi:MAG: filamentous hemagglutinin N-terminal domain-containing protein [Pseudomonadota bacterium]
MNVTRRRTQLVPARRGAQVAPARRRAWITTALVSLVLAPGAALAGPEGGVVIGGQASIEIGGATTTVRQATDRAIIDWSSFDIGAGEAVTFEQPGAGAIALNRVTGGGGASQIDGSLSATGNVWIVNPQGITIGAEAQVDVGGLIATTADIDDGAFMAGGGSFDRPGAADAVVVNDGTITFGEAGLVGLVAPQAANAGTITGQLGRVVVAGAETFSVDLAGDGILALPMGQAEMATASNTGTISVAGGSVTLDAAAVQGVLEATVFAGGTIEATSIDVAGGTISLSGGRVEVAGTLDASGGALGGGTVTVTGERVKLAETAAIDASGATGGTVRIGGDVQGQGPLPNADIALVAEGASIDVSGLGDAGSAVVWGDSATFFGGRIDATSTTGDGGFVEVSGGYLEIEGDVALAAPLGQAGTLLLDPEIIRVVPESGGEFGAPLGAVGFDILFADLGSNFALTEGDDNSTDITDAFIESVDGTLLLQATDDILVQTPVNNFASGNTLDLTLEAGDSIVFTAGMFLNGSITLNAAGAATPVDPAGTQGVTIQNFVTVSASGDVTVITRPGEPLTLIGGTLNADGALDISGVDLIDATNGTIDAGTAALALPNIEAEGFLGFFADGAITQQAGTSIVNAGLAGGEPDAIDLLAVSRTADVLIDVPSNAFSSVEARGANISLARDAANSVEAALTVRQVLGTGDVTIVSDNGGVSFLDLSFDDPTEVEVSGDTVTVQGGGAILFQPGTRLSALSNASFAAVDEISATLIFDDVTLPLAANTSIGGTTQFIGATVTAASDTGFDVVDSYAQVGFDLEIGADSTFSRIFAGVEDGSGTVAQNGFIDITVQADVQDVQVTMTDVFAEDLTVIGQIDPGDVLNEFGGTLDIDDFDLLTLTVIGSGDALFLRDGAVTDITLTPLQVVLQLPVVSLTNVDLGVAEADFDFLQPARVGGTSITLNGVRGDALAGIDTLALNLGFLEVASIEVDAQAVTKLPDATLPDGQGDDPTVNAPALTGLALTGDIPLNDDIVAIADFTTLVSVAGTTDFGPFPQSVGDGVTFLPVSVVLPSGVVNGTAVYNDFQGAVTVARPTLVALGDANALDVTIQGDGPVEGVGGDVFDVSLRANADGVGGDGALVADVVDGATINGTYIGDTVGLNGRFQTASIVSTGNATVTAGQSVTIDDSRIGGALSLAPADGDTVSDITVTDTSVVGGLTALFAGQTVPLTFERIAVTGALTASSDAAVSVTDATAGSVDLTGAPVDLVRADVLGAITAVSTGAVTVQDVSGNASLDIASGGVAQVTNAVVDTTLGVSGDTSVTLTGVEATGLASLVGPVIAINTSLLGGLAPLAAGTDLTILGADILGPLDTGQTASLSLANLFVQGDLTAASDTATTLSDVSATGLGTLSAPGLTADRVSFGSDVGVTSAGPVAITDGVFGANLTIANPSLLTLTRVSVDGDLVAIASGAIAATDLLVDGQTVLSASGDLTVFEAVLADFALGSGGALAVNSAVAGTALDADTVNAGGAAALAGLSTPATLTFSNFAFTLLEQDVVGDATLSGVSADGFFRLSSASGTITFNDVFGNPLLFQAPTLGTVEPSLGEAAFPPFTVDGATGVTFRAALPAVAAAAGPGQGTPVTVGVDTSSLTGDTDTVIDRIQVDLAPVAGSAGVGAGEPVPPNPDEPDVTRDIPLPEPAFPGGEIPGTPGSGTEGGFPSNKPLEDEIVLVAPFLETREPVFPLPSVDFGTLYSATGNENLWTQGDREAPDGNEEEAQ